MLNGALTIGTMDGANVEIFEEVGEENIFIFGMSADEVLEQYRLNTYDPWNIVNINYNVRTIMTQLISGILSDNTELFRELYDALLNGYGGSRADEYFVLKDFDSYSQAQQKVSELYRDKNKWARAAIINVAKSGKFSSDRTIGQYANEIWGLKRVPIIM
jgi:starch phosphorylase